MDFLVTFMTANRAFSKAGSRLTPKLKELEQSFSTMKLSAGEFDDIILMLVDQPPGYYRQIQNKDRIYQVEIGSPAMQSYRPAEDEQLLLAIAEQIRAALKRAPINAVDQNDILRRFSAWEEHVRRRALRLV